MSIIILDEPREATEVATSLVEVIVVKATASLPGRKKKPSDVLILKIPVCPHTKDSFVETGRINVTDTASFLKLLGVIEDVLVISRDVVAVWSHIPLDDEITQCIVKHVCDSRQLKPGDFEIKTPRKNTKLAQSLSLALKEGIKAK